MRTLLATTKSALVAALPFELLNFFVVGHPAGKHHALEGWFAAVAAQWYVVHAPGIFVLNSIEFLRHRQNLGELVLFLSGWSVTALLVAIFIWPALMVVRTLRLSKAED